MSKVIIGSARIDERGKLSGGASGDGKQKSIPDYVGEVSMQNFYLHKKGWYILRFKDAAFAEECARAMERACNNPNIGYDQGQRGGILKYGTRTNVKTECDCSVLVRQCVKEAAGVDPGNFTTSTEVAVLRNTGLFLPTIKYRNGVSLYNGDILVTCVKGHTVVVVSALPRIRKENTKENLYFPKYSGKSDSIVDALVSLKINASKDNRKKIAAANGIDGYSGTAKENTTLLVLLKQGKLIKP
jgi:hypothetical protein